MTRYRISDDDLRFVEEFRRTPVGYHSPGLQRVLNVLRGGPEAGKYVLVCTKPYREWVLGQLPGERGRPVRLLRDHVFTDRREAEWAVFRLRWQEATGRALDP